MVLTSGFLLLCRAIRFFRDSLKPTGQRRFERIKNAYTSDSSYSSIGMGTVQQQVRQILHDPLFWTILILALILIVLMFLAALGPAMPETQPYVPVYPYVGSSG